MQNMQVCVVLKCSVHFFRENGPNRRGHGPDKQRHERSREELDGHGKMLRDLRAAVQKVSVFRRFRRNFAAAVSILIIIIIIILI